MDRLVAFTVCLILVIALNSAEFSAKSLDSNINVIVQNVTFSFLNGDKEVKVLYPLIQEQLSDGVSPKVAILHKLGDRINGDRLITTAEGSWTYSSPQNIKLTLNYPRSGTGLVVTFLKVLVSQSTNKGRGYIISGGIGQRQLTVLIEADQTLYFKFSAEIYGY
ncbi:uncharacterized protein LOC116344250 [Contarinia nasturtii]|uniref:uncharacterized protein LOC116344250 n=1 Tax=Contarinia nasturtii TaxID=265458 RepID=UPI0012D3F374|nr:uncharacterized protein LOC116344250 [Contarinia nasturtii]